MKIEIEGIEVVQRKAELIKKGEKIRCDEELCFVLLPSDWVQSNIVLIKTD